MKNLYILLLFLISSNISAQDEVSANWNVTVNGNEIILSIVEFNNFTVGLDGHWHYILNEEEYVAVHDINDVIISNLPNGEHTIHIWLVDHMHNAIDPPVEETITFNIDSSLSNTHYNLLDMRIYPNPTSSMINVQFDRDIELTVYNMLGQEIMRTNEKQVDISALQNGNYIVLVRDLESNYVRNFNIIKK